jgi:hypothetical protein
MDRELGEVCGRFCTVSIRTDACISDFVQVASLSFRRMADSGVAQSKLPISSATSITETSTGCAADPRPAWPGSFRPPGPASRSAIAVSRLIG